jgi:hypothetical protein
VKEKTMDEKRRINPQNPARQIRGRKLKKHLRAPLVSTPASTTTATPAAGSENK